MCRDACTEVSYVLLQAKAKTVRHCRLSGIVDCLIIIVKVWSQLHCTCIFDQSRLYKY